MCLCVCVRCVVIREWRDECCGGGGDDVDFQGHQVTHPKGKKESLQVNTIRETWVRHCKFD